MHSGGKVIPDDAVKVRCGGKVMRMTLSKVRPAKVRSAVRRRWFERQLGRTELTGAGQPIHLGSAYGGWMVPAALIRPGWTCYSVGVGGDVTFDAELIRRFGGRVRAFDPVREYVDFAAQEIGREPRFSVDRAAIAERDGPIQMQSTHYPGSKAVSAAALFDTTHWQAFPGRSLPSLMAEFSDERIDLLKMDTEGTEYGLLPSLDLPALGIKVLAVCFHHSGSVGQARELLGYLSSLDYEAVAMCPVVKITLVHRSALPRSGGITGFTPIRRAGAAT
jgi:FkbM family methyltransferase